MSNTPTPVSSALKTCQPLVFPFVWGSHEAGTGQTWEGEKLECDKLKA